PNPCHSPSRRFPVNSYGALTIPSLVQIRCHRAGRCRRSTIETRTGLTTPGPRKGRRRFGLHTGDVSTDEPTRCGLVHGLRPPISEVPRHVHSREPRAKNSL